MVHKRFLPVLLCSLFCSVGMAAGTELQIVSQKDFDCLGETLDALASRGERDIHVRFAPGVYFFQENHIALIGWDYPDMDLEIDGSGAMLVGAGDDCPAERDGNRFSAALTQAYDPDAALVSMHRLQPLDTRSEARFAFSYPLPTFRHDEYVILTRAGELHPEESGHARLFFSQWYESGIYPIHRIRRGWIRFSVKDRNPGKPSLYSELRYGRCRPRYMVDNEISDAHPYVQGNRVYHQEMDTLHFCHASTFLRMEQVVLQTFRIHDLHFLGNSASAPLLDFRSVFPACLTVSDCRFTGIRSDVIALQDVDDAQIRGNVIRNCYRNGMVVDNGCNRTVISGNDMGEIGLGYSNYSAILCKGKDFVITDNRIFNFCYNGIGLGLHYTEEAGQGTSGLVSHNELFQTEDFRRNRRMSLTDSGAIYVCTQTDGIDIVGNYIHDIGGPHGNSGIFCDDGACNILISRNLVLNVENDYCIDLRRCFSVTRISGFKIPAPNCGNRMSGNVVDGAVRFFVRRSDPGSVRGRNVHLPRGADRSEWERRWHNRELS